MTTTILVINGISFPPTSARGLTQTLDPIEQSAVMQRTVDGDLDDLSLSQFQKYRSTISCQDFDAPALDGIFPGMQVVVDCVPELAYPDPEDEVVLGDNANRPIVPDSARLKNGFVRYRPRLTMRVMRFSISRAEWAGSTNWTLELEEV